MNNLKQILKNKQLTLKVTVGKPINKKYEQAKSLADYINIPIFVVMRMQKQYGSAKVERLRTFLKDYPNLDKKRAIGLCYWFLKQ